jgi:hypothetical protein
MRWPKRIPNEGETRGIWRFCWLPFEWRGINFWLESVHVRQQYRYRLGLGFSWRDIEVMGIEEEK